MSLYYSAEKHGFFDKRIHSALPADAVPITAEQHAALLNGQAQGKRIAANDDGRPHLVAPKATTLAERREAAMRAAKREARRRILAVASLERQANDAALIALHALALARNEANGDLDAGAAAGAAIVRRMRIDAIRSASDTLEAHIAELGARALAQLDPTADHHWPN